MVILLVTSLSNGAGKTAICIGIGKHLQNRGKTLGYLRPIIGTPPVGSDAAFMKDVLGLPEPPAAIYPSFTNEAQYNAGIKNALNMVAAGKDVVIIESAFAGVARTLGAKVILVATYADLTDSRLASAYQALGQQGAGIIINKVPSARLADIRSTVKANFSKAGMPVIGIIPEDRAMMTLTIAELAEAIDGQILNNPGKADALAESFLLGAMTVDNALPYFNLMTNKVAIVRSERPDMQMAALETSTRAVVITGTTPLVPLVRNRAESREVPFISTKLDCASVAGRIEEKMVNTRFHQRSKLPLLLEMIAQNLDFDFITKAAGL